MNALHITPFSKKRVIDEKNHDNESELHISISHVFSIPH